MTLAKSASCELKSSAWLSNANFAPELADVTGLAQVPVEPSFDIICYLGATDVIAYRTRLEDLTTTQAIRLGGADTTFAVPSFLLPHHEYVPSTGRQREAGTGD